MEMFPSFSLESQTQSHRVAIRVILACEMIEDEVILALDRIGRAMGAGSLHSLKSVHELKGVKYGNR